MELTYNREILILRHLMAIGHAQEPEVLSIFNKLTNDHFANHGTRKIFALIKSRFEEQKDFNAGTLVDIAPQIDEQSFKVLSECITELKREDYSIKNAIDAVCEARSKTLSQTIIKSLGESFKSVETPQSALQRISESQIALMAIETGVAKHAFSTEDLMEEVLKKEKEGSIKLSTGLAEIDQALRGGFKVPGLVTIAAKSGTGKSNFAVFLSMMIAKNNPEKKNIFFSLEMPVHEIGEAMVSISMGKRIEGMTQDEKSQAIAKCMSLNFKFYDYNYNYIESIESACSIESRTGDIGVIVVDYFSYVSTQEKFNSSNDKGLHIGKKLWKIANDYNCIVIALSQVNREASKRNKNDRCPTLDDTSSSSALIFDSTVWIGCDRPFLYTEDPADQNKFVVKSRKVRGGNPFSFWIPFNDACFSKNTYRIYE